jgi:tRNA pseudouridine38-40 synthase
MRTLRLTLAYDGTDYAGWQVQPDQLSAQEVVERALEKITGSPVRILASGRTDAGVHALGQVASFRTDTRLTTDVLHRALNGELPTDVAVLDVAEAPEGFHPIRDAAHKRYRYTIHDGPVRDVFGRRYSWHYRRHLDADSMHRAAVKLLGTHDFAAFQTSGAPRQSTVRTIFDISVRRGRGGQSDVITLEVEADGFLYNMVRTIVGTLVEVGRGAQSEAWVSEVLASADRRQAGLTAPPQGLFLVSVTYDGIGDRGS